MNLRRMTIVAACLSTAASLTACAGSGSSDSTVKADCTPAHTFPTIDKGALTVVLYDLPPFSKLDGKTVNGVDGDIVNAIAEKECLTVKAIAVSAAASIPTVQSGRADLAIAAWYRTAERAEVVSLSDPLYTDQMAIISKDGVSSIPSLKDRKVGTVDGYLWVEDMKKYLGSSLKIYPSTVNMNQDLKAGRIDVGVDSFGSGVFNNKDLQVKVVEPFDEVSASLEDAQICLPVPKSNPKLLAAINEDIAELHESGEIVKILEKHDLDRSAADTGEPRFIS